MAISENFSNDALLSELRMYVEDISDEDLQSCLSTITEIDENTYQIKVLDKTLRFNKELCGVEEI